MRNSSLLNLISLIGKYLLLLIFNMFDISSLFNCLRTVKLSDFTHVVRLNIQANTHTLLIGEYVVKNRSWMFQGSNEFRGDISSSVSPQGHSPQAAAEAAIMALHLTAPFNWLMLFDVSAQSSQLASGRLQLEPGLNAAENFAKPWYKVAARLESIRRTWFKAAAMHSALTDLLENSEVGKCGSDEGSYSELSVSSRYVF